MTDPTLDSYLEIYDGAGRFIGADDDGGTAGTDARITFTAAYSGFYYVVAGTSGAAATGSYTLAVQ